MESTAVHSIYHTNDVWQIDGKALQQQKWMHILPSEISLGLIGSWQMPVPTAETLNLLAEGTYFTHSHYLSIEAYARSWHTTFFDSTSTIRQLMEGPSILGSQIPSVYDWVGELLFTIIIYAGIFLSVLGSPIWKASHSE